MKKFDVKIFMSAVRREAGENSCSGPDLAEIGRLLALEDEEFITRAYRAFLGREPDPAGMKAYLPRTQSLAGRVRVLASLWISPERLYLPPWQRAMIKAIFHKK